MNLGNYVNPFPNVNKFSSVCSRYFSKISSHLGLKTKFKWCNDNIIRIFILMFIGLLFLCANFYTQQGFIETVIKLERKTSENTSAFTDPEKVRGNCLTRIRNYEIQTLMMNFTLEFVLPVLDEDSVWVLDALEKDSSRVIMTPILIRGDTGGDYQRLNEEIFSRIDGLRDKMTILISVGGKLKKLLYDVNIVSTVLGCKVSVYSPANNLVDINGNQVTRSNAGKLNIYTVLSIPENHRYEHLDYNTRGSRSNLVERSNSTRTIGSNSTYLFDFLRGVPVPPPQMFDDRCQSFTVYRLIYTPQENSGLLYALGDSWFLEMVSYFKLGPDGDFSIEHNRISNNLLPLDKVRRLTNINSHSCLDSKLVSGIKFDSSKKNYPVFEIRQNHSMIIPNLENLEVKFIRKCHRRNMEKHKQVTCFFTEKDNLVCRHESNEMRTRRRRGALDVAIPSLHQQIVSSNPYQKLESQSKSSKNSRVNRRSTNRRVLYSTDYYTFEDRWENFKAAIPQMFGCIGTTSGCTFCFIFLFFSTVHINPGVCMGACGVAIGGSCSTMLSLGIQRTLHQTVVCSELYRQGLLPSQSYIADASFGLKLSRTHPESLEMYRTVASPVVELMKSSETFTAVISSVSQPWIQHMEYTEGLRPADNIFGNIMTSAGLCLLSLLHIVQKKLLSVTSSVTVASLCLYLLHKYK